MEIYFDDVLINEDYYTSLSTNFALFSDTFYLGSTASNIYNISIAKETVITQPNIISIKDKGILIATLVVDKVEEDDFEYKYTLTDKMINLEFNYDASEIFNNGSATLLEIAQDICNKAEIELATMNFRGFNKKISWYDNTRTAREYIGYIAELNGGYAQIGKDGRLYFIKQNTSSVKTISIDDCSDFNIGEKHTISRVVYEQGTLKYEYGDETGNTLYLNGDNVYITEQSEVEEIFNEINGFEFYSFSTNNCPIDYEIMAGQIITFNNGTSNYPTIVGYNLTYNGEWYGGYDLEVATKKQEETQIIGTSERIRNLSIKIDRESNKITQSIKEIDEQNQKISQVTQTVNELNSKIGDIADITISADNYGSVSLERINESEPIYVKVRPYGEDIAYLYPQDNLYPADELYPQGRTLRFASGDFFVDYELPADLLYYDNENYDEFILDYDSQSCIVNKKVGWNADGSKYILNTPKTLTFSYPKILLENGDYTVTMLGYNAYLFVRLMAQNIYTTQFATKAELSSEIKQTADEIDLSVNKKLSNYSTTNEINSQIAITSEAIINTVNQKLEDYDTSSEVSSKIEQKADSITSSVSKTYSTKTETATAKNEAINSANASTDNKLKNYSTTTQMNSAISQKADSITSTVASTYETKTNASNTYATKTQLSTAKSEIKQTTDSIQAQVNSNDTDISTLNQTAKEISTKVEGKVDGNKIISTINQSSEAVGINANKINLSANDVLNLLAGNTINLSGKQIAISSDNFSVGTDGAMKCKDATFTGGEVILTDDGIGAYEGKLRIQGDEFINGLYSDGITIRKIGSSTNSSSEQSIFLHMYRGEPRFGMHGTSRDIASITESGISFILENDVAFNVSGTNKQASLLGVTAFYLNGNIVQGSLESIKKNIEKYNGSAIDVIRNSDIYTYNLKTEQDTDKKHVGFVIGKNYNTPQEVIANSGEGIDTYTMCSILWKAVQEQQQEIEKLKQEKGE